MKVAERTRRAARELGEYDMTSLSNVMGLETYQEQARLRNTIKDFVKRGEMVRIGYGRYRYCEIKKPPTIRQRLWDVVRRMPTPFYSIYDLEQVTGCNMETIREFCGWLVAEGYAVREKRGHFKRIGRMGPRIGSAERRAPQLNSLRPGGITMIPRGMDSTG